MYYNETSIAALHQARSTRLHGKADGRTNRLRRPALRTLLTPRLKALGPAPVAQPVQNG